MSKKKITSEKLSQENSAIYTIANDFSIASIESIKKEIEELLTTSDKLVIKGENIKTIDLTGIQLLYSLRHTDKDNKKITFEITLKEEVQNLLGKAGFDITKIK